MSDFRGQRRMGRLVRDDRKASVTQITIRYNQGMQNTISECTTCRTLKQMGYSSRRPHRVLLLSAKIRKQRLRFTQDHQNWTIEDWKNVVWSDESRFLLQHSDGLLNHHQCAASTWMIQRQPQYNGTSALTTHQLQVERRERVIEPVTCMGIIRRP